MERRWLHTGDLLQCVRACPARSRPSLATAYRPWVQRNARPYATAVCNRTGKDARLTILGYAHASNPSVTQVSGSGFTAGLASNRAI